MDGHFQDIKTWSDLETLNAAKYGSLIALKENSKEIPVFQAISHYGKVLPERSASTGTYNRLENALPRIWKIHIDTSLASTMVVETGYS